jgi:hypothetical protein
MAWESWEDERVAGFRMAVLDRVEAITREVAAEAVGESCAVRRTEWDAPNVEVVWASDGLQRNVNQLIVGMAWPVEIEFTAAAWADGEGEGRWLRYVDLPRGHRTVSVGSLQELDVVVAPALQSAIAQVKQLRREADGERAMGAAGTGD